jgi:hypothetical protein
LRAPFAPNASNLPWLPAAEVKDLVTRSPERRCDRRLRNAGYVTTPCRTLDGWLRHRTREKDVLHTAAHLAGDFENGIDHRSHSLTHGLLSAEQGACPTKRAALHPQLSDPPLECDGACHRPHAAGKSDSIRAEEPFFRRPRCAASCTSYRALQGRWRPAVHKASPRAALAKCGFSPRSCGRRRFSHGAAIRGADRPTRAGRRLWSALGFADGTDSSGLLRPLPLAGGPWHWTD